jgi:hypothetical protein
MGVNWWKTGINLVADIIDKIPLEKMLIPERDTRKDNQELMEIYKNSPITQTPAQPKPQPTRTLLSDKSDIEKPSDQETIQYQNREIGKILLQMERHASQRFRINGRACDCGSQKHLLDLEELCEETISMVGNKDVYYKIINLGKEIAPKVIPETVGSGLYDDEFPEYAKQYRDLRKELMGSLDYDRLLEKKEAPELTEGRTEGTPAELIPEVL